MQMDVFKYILCIIQPKARCKNGQYTKTNYLYTYQEDVHTYIYTVNRGLTFKNILNNYVEDKNYS